MAVERREATDQVQENDGVSIAGINESVGTFIKKKALEKYEAFSSLTIQEQTVVSLGMNLILDLSFEFEEGQSTLFTRSQWNALQARFPAAGPGYDDLDKSLENLTILYTRTLGQLSNAKTGQENK